MDRSEWLAQRKTGIGGSDAGAVMGLNPYRTAFDVYIDKTDPAYETGDNEAMRQGRDLEEYVASRFVKETGKKVRRCNQILRCPAYLFALANVDRLIVGEDAGLECKTASPYNADRFDRDDIPPEYYCQCMHYMAVTGRKRWYLAVLIFGQAFKVYTIDRDEDEIAALMEAEREFWEENVEKGVPPIPGGSKNTDAFLKKVFPEEQTEEAVMLYEDGLERYKMVKQMIADLEQEKTAYEQQIKLKLGEASEGLIQDGNGDLAARFTWRTQQRISWDVSSILEDYQISPEEAEAYKIVTSSRVFRSNIK